jgi:hypothetical protein
MLVMRKPDKSRLAYPLKQQCIGCMKAAVQMSAHDFCKRSEAAFHFGRLKMYVVSTAAYLGLKEEIIEYF